MWSPTSTARWCGPPRPDPRSPACKNAPFMAGREQGFGRWAVRLLALGGVFLMVLGATGWWLSTRVLDADGFGDVVAKTSQREAVRDYIADQATLRLARTSNFVSAARPVVTDAISAAINTPPVKEAVHDFVARAHDQVFQAHSARRVDVDSPQAAVTVRSALQTINPALAKKLPAERPRRDDHHLAVGTRRRPVSGQSTGSTTSTCRCSSSDSPSSGSRCVRRDRVHAIRVVGVAHGRRRGAPARGRRRHARRSPAVAGTADPGRGEAVATFIEVLVGRLVGGGQAFVVIGILLALAPGHDGGDLRDRVGADPRLVVEKRTRPRWRFAGGAALVVLARVRAHRPHRLLPDPAGRRRARRPLRRRRGVPPGERADGHRSHDQAAAQAAGLRCVRGHGHCRPRHRVVRGQPASRARPTRRGRTRPTRAATATSSSARSR